MSHEITIKGGKSKKLLTGGKFCEHDIVVHAQGEIKLQSNKTVTPATDRQTVLPDSGYDALDKVTVEAMPQANLSAPSISVSSSGQITATSTQSKSGYVEAGTSAFATSRIPSSYVQPTGSKSITENGQHEVKNYAYVNVNVASSGGGDDSFKAVIERTATEVTLPSNLTKIGNYAFDGCSNLTLTSLPDGISSIGGCAFYNCSNLALTSLPDGITSIGANAFYECTSLSLTSLPNRLTNIGPYAFDGCKNLALTSLPSGITVIDNNAFYECTSLSLTSLPSSITRIGYSTFQSCTNLKKITFNGKPNSIGGTAFQYCNNLLTINVPWAEGEVSGAPWGATKATINYNYTGG